MHFSASTPRPNLRAQARLDDVTLAGGFDLALAVADYVPGATGPQHSHPAPILVIVVEGGLTLREPGKAPRVVRAGESWIERAGDVHDVVNAGSAKATLVAQQIVPKGAAPSTPVTAPAPAAPGGLFLGGDPELAAIPRPCPFEGFRARRPDGLICREAIAARTRQTAKPECHA